MAGAAAFARLRRCSPWRATRSRTTGAGACPAGAGRALGQARPYYRVLRPPGEGPFPTALLYSGCDGPQDNLERWAAMLNARGWAAIIVDSHGPRGFSDYEVWRLVCAGQLFMGSERAGDVLVSIDDARRMPFVDPDRMALVGASHGGWAIMDLLALDPPRRLPFNLSALPDGRAGRPARRRRRDDPALSLLRRRQPRRPRRLAPADPDALPARRGRRGRRARRLPARSPSGWRRAACRSRRWLFGRDPRLRPEGAGGAQHPRLRRGGDRDGAGGGRGLPRQGGGAAGPLGR